MIAAVWIALGIAMFAYLALVPSLLRRTLSEALLVFLPLIAVLFALVWTVLQMWGGDVGPQVQAALIGGTIVGMGWIVAFLIAQYGEAKARDTRRRDTLLALRSEIFSVVDKLDNQPITESAKDVQNRIRTLGSVYHPFSTIESEPIVLKTIGASIWSLEEPTVTAVLRFYAEHSDMCSMVEDSRSEFARALDADRRIALHKELTKRRAGTLRWGLKACVEINRELAIPGKLTRSGVNIDIDVEP